MIDNKFLAYNDEKMTVVSGFELPPWWSRPFEYAWASKFTNKKKVCLDAGCGIEHPFKYYLAENSKHCTAMDIDERLKLLKKPDNMTFCIGDMALECNAEIPFNVDTIFCISVLEHLRPDQQIQTIKNFAKWLKPGGKIVLTLDYPTVRPENILNMVEPYFEVGKTNYEPDNKANIVMPQFNLKVFTLVATLKDVV